MRMLEIFMPRQKNFFVLFSKSTEILLQATVEFDLLLHDLPSALKHSKCIAAYEKEADLVVNTIFKQLHNTFITPFDHYDMQQITKKMDDILDAINITAQRIALYGMTSLPPTITALGGLCNNLSHLVYKCILLLPHLKKSIIILDHCQLIATLKNEAENNLTYGIANLIDSENDIKLLLKTKDIYECANVLINEYEDLANVIKSIILEYG